MRPACAFCGARLTPGADRCDLCGTPVDGAEALAPDAEAPEAAGAVAPEAAVADARGRTCASCGHANPPGARFCNACGADLAEAQPELAPVRPPASEPSGARPPSTAGRRALVVVGVALATVVGLYAVTALSGGEPAPPATAAADGLPAASDPSGPTPALPDSLQLAADRLEAGGTATDLFESGRYYLTAAYDMAGVEPESSVLWAREAARLFEASLAEEDRDRTRLALAEAIRVDPSPAAPMRPVQEVQAVLERDPTNVTALFLLADLRLERGQFEPAWRDSAEVLYERVIELAPPGDRARVQAEARLEFLRDPEAAAGG